MFRFIHRLGDRLSNCSIVDKAITQFLIIVWIIFIDNLAQFVAQVIKFHFDHHND